MMGKRYGHEMNAIQWDVRAEELPTTVLNV